MLVELSQGTPEWHEWRKNGIGGSDAPVVEGISPYRTPRQLFYEKKGLPYPDDGSKDYIFAKGHEVEDFVRDEFQKLVKAELKPACFVHDSFEFVRASLDGFHPTLGVLEAKLVGQEILKNAAEKGEIPAHHLSQMQHQFAATGADIGQWFGHDGKKRGIVIEVRRDEEYIKRLLEKEHQFWEDLKSDKMPPLSEKDYLLPEDDKLLKDLRDAKELAENAEAQYEALKKKAIELYGHPKIAGAGIKLFKVTRQGSLSLLKIPEVKTAADKIVSELDPEYVESFRGKSVESWSIRISE